jgi:ribosomal protein L40E
MGRWAEVYFTSPPEKREEAVLNLLRELEEEASLAPNSAPAASPEIPNEGEPHAAQAFASAELTQEMKRNVVSCRSCGANNPPHQKFCGQCGTSLGPGEARPASHSPTSFPTESAQFSSPNTQYDAQYDTRYEGAHNGNSRYEDPRTSVEPERESDTYFAARHPQELRWLQAQDIEPPKLMPEYEPVPYRYRIYVGTAIALLIGTLLYIAWRGAQVSSANSRALPQAAAAANTEPPAPSQTAMAEPPAKGGSLEGKTNNAAAPANRTATQPASNARAPVSDATGLKKASDVAPVPTGTSAQPPDASTQDNGSRELALAQSYLSNTQGRVRDSSEAAKWLWQAVRKENATATLLLSELYLRGDGVPKSCDQGRLLLNAAGRRGVPGAGERIRNLQAFGCQ